MDITFSAPDSFKIVSRQLSVAYGEKIQAKVDLRLLSQPVNSKAAEGEIVLDCPGEYEIKSAMVTGVATKTERDANTAYQLSVDDLKLGFLGQNSKLLDDAQLEQLGAIDILIVSLSSMGSDLLAQQIATISPSIVIPMDHDDKSLKALVDNIGSQAEPVEKYKISKKDLPTDTTLVVIK